MAAYVLRRLVGAIPVIGVVMLFVFLLLYLTPGDPAALIAGDSAASADIARVREKLGLDQPLPARFANWLIALLHGDLGRSVFSNAPVTQLIGQRIEPTLSLALCTLILAIAVAIPAGVVAARHAGRAVDRAIMGLSVLGFSVPAFVLAYLLVALFSIQLNWLPVQGFRSIREGPGPFLRHIALPSMALGLIYIALIARMTRASMLEVLSQDYIRTASAKGLAARQILVRHALKNAGVPIVTVIGIGMGLLLSGVVVTETVFAIPGLGRLTVDAILHRDYPVIQGLLLLFSGVYVLINLLVDISYVFFDPRIRY